MTKYLTLEQVHELHADQIRTYGGALGMLNEPQLLSALAQPRMAFGGQDLYPSVIEKAVALSYSLTMNHAFVDGNKRVGFAALDFFLRGNGWALRTTIDEAEQVMLAVAAGTLKREAYLAWVVAHAEPRDE